MAASESDIKMMWFTSCTCVLALLATQAGATASEKISASVAVEMVGVLISFIFKVQERDPSARSLSDRDYGENLPCLCLFTMSQISASYTADVQSAGLRPFAPRLNVSSLCLFFHV